MHYEINVSHNGQHFFATSSRSITVRADLERVFPVLSKKFPKSEGYELSVTKEVTSGHVLNDKDLLDLLL